MTREKHAGNIRVLIVDDQLTVLWGLERLVGGCKTKMTVVGTATTGARALEMAGDLEPDVILLDVDLDTESGLDAMPALLKKSRARIVVLTDARDAALRDQAVLAGARGIVGKHEPPGNILKAIEKVHAGEIWPAIGRVQSSRHPKGGQQSEEQKRIARLSAREREIVSLLTNEPESSITALAKKIHRSEHTVRNHLTSIYSKLGVASRLQLHVFATRHKLG